jgi:hypothetical protein
MKRCTFKASCDGHEDVGLRDGVTISEAMCQLADIEGVLFDDTRERITLDELTVLIDADCSNRIQLIVPEPPKISIEEKILNMNLEKIGMPREKYERLKVALTREAAEKGGE